MTTARQQFGSGRRDSPPGNRTSAALLTSAVLSGLTLAVAFGLLALGVESFWVTFVVGFGFVLPMSIGVVARLYPEDGQGATGLPDTDTRPTTGSRDRTETADTGDRPAMEALRLQYARGELSEAEFERRVELLLENEN